MGKVGDCSSKELIKFLESFGDLDKREEGGDAERAAHDVIFLSDYLQVLIVIGMLQGMEHHSRRMLRNLHENGSEYFIRC